MMKTHMTPYTVAQSGEQEASQKTQGWARGEGRDDRFNIENRVGKRGTLGRLL